MPWVFSALCLGCALGLVGWLGAAQRDRLPLVLPISVLAAAGLSTAIALIQYFGLEKPFAPWLASSFKGEAFSNLRQKNQFASLAVMGFWALAFVSLQRRAQGRAWVWAAALGLAAWLGLGNAMAASRTGLAALLLSLVVLALWAWRSGHARALAQLAVANVAGFAFGSLVLPLLRSGGATIVERAGMGAEGCHSRLVLWQNVWQLALDKPLTGWGWGSMKQAHYEGVFASRFCEILDNAHNLPLHLAMELGLPVAVLFVLATLWFVWRTWPPTVSLNHPFDERHMACGMLGVVLLHSMLEYPLWYGPFQIATLLALAILWQGRPGAAGVPSDPFLKHFPQGVAVFWVSIATLLIAFALAVWYDYWRISQIYTEPENRAAAYKDDTLRKIQGSWFFQDQVDFADLSITPIEPDNAAERLALAQRMLRHSPEPRVVEALLRAAHLSQRKDLVDYHLPRFQAAYPNDFATWAQSPDGMLIRAGSSQAVQN